MTLLQNSGAEPPSEFQRLISGADTAEQVVCLPAQDTRHPYQFQREDVVGTRLLTRHLSESRSIFRVAQTQVVATRRQV